MRLKKISKQVFILGLISFFTDFASEMLYPVTPLFLTAALGASMTVVGVIEGVAEVIAGFLKGYFGALSDKLGKRSVFISSGYGLSAISKSLPGIFPNLGMVIFSRISDRVGKGIRTAPRDALLAADSGKNSGAVFGFHRSMDTFGAVAGPLAALLFLYFVPGDYVSIYLLAIIPSVFAVFFTFRVKDVKTKEISNSFISFREFWKSSSPLYKRFMLIFALFSLVNSSDVFLILRSKAITGSDSIAILGYVFYNFIYATASYPSGLLADRFGKKSILIVSMFVFSAVYFGFAVNENYFLVWLLFALYGVYSASSEGIAKAWISDLTEKQYHGSAIGLFNTVTSLSIMIGSFIAGILWDYFGPSAPFLISGVVGFISAIMLLSVKNRTCENNN